MYFETSPVFFGKKGRGAAWACHEVASPHSLAACWDQHSPLSALRSASPSFCHLSRFRMARVPSSVFRPSALLGRCADLRGMLTPLEYGVPHWGETALLFPTQQNSLSTNADSPSTPKSSMVVMSSLVGQSQPRASDSLSLPSHPAGEQRLVRFGNSAFLFLKLTFPKHPTSIASIASIPFATLSPLLPTPLHSDVACHIRPRWTTKRPPTQSIPITEREATHADLRYNVPPSRGFPESSTPTSLSGPSDDGICRSTREEKKKSSRGHD